jgi:diguanylate cyclase (GGDEF)-like protein/PAS domain S-box-containing protein
VAHISPARAAEQTTPELSAPPAAQKARRPLCVCVLAGARYLLRYASEPLLAALPAGALDRPLLDVLPHLQDCGFEEALERAAAGAAQQLGPVSFLPGAGERAEIAIVPLPEGSLLLLVLPAEATVSEAANDAPLDLPPELLRGIIEAIPYPLIVRDAAGRPVEANSALAELLGLSRAEVLALRPNERRWRLLRPDGVQLAPQEILSNRVRASGRAEARELYKLIREDNEERWIESTVVPVAAADGRPLLTVCSVVDVTAREQTQRDLSRRNVILDGLYGATLALLGDEPLDTLLERVAEHVARVTGASSSTVALLSEDGRRMPCVAAYGALKEVLGISLEYGIGVGGQAWASRKVVVVNDYAQWPGRQPAAYARLYTAVAAAPLLRDDTVIGVLTIAHDRPGATFDATAIAALEQISRIVALVLANARLREDVRRELDERRRAEARLAALHQATLALLENDSLDALFTAVLEQMTPLFGTSRGYIAVVEPDASALVVRAGAGAERALVGWRMARGEGVGGRVWETGAPLVVKNYVAWEGRLPPTNEPERNPLGHVAAVPLLGRRGVVGVLAVNHDEPDVDFGPEQIATLEQFGRLVSLALQKAQLYDTARRELDERRRVEEALRAEEQRVRAMFQSAAIGIVLMDRDGRVQEINRALLAILGRKPEEVIGQRGGSFVHPEDRVLIAEYLRPLSRGMISAGVVDVRMLRADGAEVWCTCGITALRDGNGKTQGFVGTVIDISARRQAEQALARQNAYLTALHETTLAVINHLDLRALLDTLVQRAAALLDTPHGYVYLVEEESQMLCAVAGVGMFAGIDEIIRLRRGEGLAGRVWETGQAIVLDDYSAWSERVPGGARRDRMRATAAVPLWSRNAVVGVLTVVHTDPERRFDAEAVRVLEQFARLASLAIDNTMLHRTAQSELEERRRAEADLRQRNGYLMALQRTTLALIQSDNPETLINLVLREATALFGATRSYLALLQPDGERMAVVAAINAHVFRPGKTLTYGKGVGGRVWATGRAIAITDYPDWEERDPGAPEVNAVVGVPLLRGNSVAGVLTLVYDDAGAMLDEAALALLEQFGQLVSLALHNAQLRTRAQRELEERRRAEEALRRRNGYLAALHGTTLALSNLADLTSTLETILTRARAALATEHALLELAEEGDDELTIRLATGCFAAFVGQRVRRGEGLDGQVWETGAPLVVHDYATWPWRREGALYDALGAVAAVPLRVGAEVVGVLELARLRGEPGFAIEEVEALVQFGQLAAIAVANARLNETMRAAQAELRRQLDMTAAITNNLGEGVIALDEHERITRLNPAAESMLGWVESELAGQLVWRVLERDEACGHRVPASRALLEDLIRSGRPFRIDDALFTRRDGTLLAVDYSASPIVSEGKRLGTVIAFHDISERKRQTAQLEYQALHDALTGLPNRVLLHDRLAQAIRLATRSGEPLALLLIDLDGFKEVNDTLGHQAGDALLRQVARRLLGALRESDTVARLGGDEFAILLPGMGSAGAPATARRLLQAIGQTTAIDDYAIDVGASIGIALFPEHGAEPETLLRHADVAMYVAKRDRSGIAIYAPEHDRHTPERLAMMSELRAAVQQEQFELHFQPIVALHGCNVVRAEALIRWRHPRHGLLSPDTFIPLVEDTNLVMPLTRWVLGEALRHCERWHRAGRPIGVAVNVSPRVLHEAELPRLLKFLLARHKLPASAVTLEITEGALISYPQRALDMLMRLHKLGVRLAIDDFGTGYSSLAYVKQLPIDEIKIDKSFVIDMRDCESDAAIVRSTIDLAHNLGMQTVAEGVEHDAACQQLLAFGCDQGQGFFFARPLPAEQFDLWLFDAA